MRRLTAAEVAKAVGSHLTRAEVGAVIERRDVIVRLFDAKIAERGEAPILFTLPR
jgi:hypothetical protein